MVKKNKINLKNSAKDQIKSIVVDATDIEQEINDQEQMNSESAIMKEIIAKVETFFLDEFGKPCVKISNDDVYINCKVKSEEFEDICEKIYWDEFEQPLPDRTLKQIIKRLSCISKFDKSRTSGKIKQHVRAVQKGEDKTIWYSLNDQKRRAVEIKKSGWDLVDEPPCFRRFDHMGEQVPPDRTGDFKKIEEYITIDNYDEKILLIIWIVAQFIPAIEKPLLAIYGPQGSAKSTLSTLIRLLVDPSQLMLVTFPATTNELAQNLYQNYMPVYDNISKISLAQSDTLCRAVTGGGIQKRKLYTDAETITWSFKRGIILNGIDHLLNRPDLMERAISIKMKRIDTGNFTPKEEILEKFKTDVPEILGGIFDLLSKTLEAADAGVTSGLGFPRMAEFAKWGFFIAEALGIGGETFIRAYENNINSHDLQVVTENLVTTCLTRFIQEQPENAWTGMMKSLLDELNKTRIELGYEKPPKEWPVNPSRLSREINKYLVNIEGLGLKYECKRKIEGVQVTIKYIKKTPTEDTSSDIQTQIGTPSNPECNAEISIVNSGLTIAVANSSGSEMADEGLAA